jgi:hypothetical protein
MIVREPISHWNNFPVPELQKILEHCRALESLGIGQDEEMMRDIEREIMMREKKITAHYIPFEPKHTKTKQRTKKPIAIKINKRQQPQEDLLEKNVYS